MDVIYVIERVIMWFVLLNIVCVNNVVIEFVLLDGICLTLLLCYSIDYFVISCYFDYSADNKGLFHYARLDPFGDHGQSFGPIFTKLGTEGAFMGLLMM